jgi:hypothetical protein
VLAATLVVVAGAILGVAGFAVEQSRADWHPHVVRTAAGWRISEPGAGMGDPALAGDHLAWQDGPSTVVMDLRSGRSRLIGDGVNAGSVASPAVSASGVVWEECPADTTRRSCVYGFDFATGRRLLLGEAATPPTTPALSGAAVYWLSGDEVIGCDLAGGEPAPIAQQTGIGPFLMASGALVAWSQQASPGAPFQLTLHDATAGTTAPLRLPGQTPGTVFDPPVLADGTLAWLRSDRRDSTASITTYDLQTLTERQAAVGRGLVGPGFDGETVVWAQPAGAGAAIMASSRDDATPVTVAHVATGVQSVLVSGDTVAWWMRTANRSWIETTRLPS